MAQKANDEMNDNDVLRLMQRRLKKLSRKCEHLAKRADVGLMTQLEKRQKANEMAKEYLFLSKAAEKLLSPQLGAYFEHACFRVALKLKYLAVKDAQPTRRGLDIKRKVSSPSKGWRS